MFEDVYEKIKKREAEALKKYEKHKKLFRDYEKGKATWKDLLKYFTDLELVTLANRNKFKIRKTPQQIKEELEEKKKQERIKRLESKLTPEELKIRREFQKKVLMMDIISRNGPYINLYWTMGYTKPQLKKLRKIPIKVAKKVLLPEEFEEVKKKVYEEE